MKKTFSLRAPGKADARVVESIKHDVRKYVQRERRKTLPAGFDQWEFDCRVGATATAAEPRLLPQVGAAIDGVVAAGGTEIFLEITAVAAHRIPRVTAPPASTPPPEVVPPANPQSS